MQIPWEAIILPATSDLLETFPVGWDIYEWTRALLSPSRPPVVHISVKRVMKDCNDDMSVFQGLLTLLQASEKYGRKQRHICAHKNTGKLANDTE